MQLETLARISEAIAATRGRLAKVELLAGFLRDLEAGERETGVAWLAGFLPGGKLGLGPSAIHPLLATPSAAAPSLSLLDVRRRVDSLRDIAGKGSAARRQAVLGELFAAATAAEQRVLARLLLGELRQGALEGVMADAIAAAAELPAGEVRRALMLAGAGGMPAVAAAALAEGAAGLARFRLTLFEPLSPMLASPGQDVDEALAALGTAWLDYKIDGARAQIHKRETEVRIYSRKGRDVSFSLPEIVAAIQALPARSLILDAEVIAMDAASGRPRPFQDTLRRFGRKLEVEAAQAGMPLSLFCFDCLHLDGEDLIDRPLEERLAWLARAVPAPLAVPRLLTADPIEARDFLVAALERGHEGLMAKDPASLYEAGRRGASWLKLKVAHTLDLVVLAAEWGSGRRRGWLSNLHLGAREGGGFVMLGKTFKGMSDEVLAWQTERLGELALDDQQDARVLRVRPELVVEIAFNELQASPRYPGGLALRFARVIRYRPDKSAEEADTMETVRTIAGKPPPQGPEQDA